MYHYKFRHYTLSSHGTYTQARIHAQSLISTISRFSPSLSLSISLSHPTNTLETLIHLSDLRTRIDARIRVIAERVAYNTWLDEDTALLAGAPVGRGPRQPPLDCRVAGVAAVGTYIDILAPHLLLRFFLSFFLCCPGVVYCDVV